jgi:pectinesterase
MNLSVGPSRELSTITSALNKGDGSPLVINLDPGQYREKLVIDRPDVTLLGQGNVTVVYDDSASTIIHDERIGTFRSASVSVSAPNFTARNITFSNDFDYPSHEELVARNPGKNMWLQAVAFRVSPKADNTHLVNCTFLGWQDTLYLDSGFTHLEGCTIKGNIDFILGSGAGLFHSCFIISRGSGYICAPSTRSDDLGFLFYQCCFQKDTKKVPPRSVWLGRPWHPGADPFRISYAGLVDCYLDDHICPEGWTSMHGNVPGGGQMMFYPKDSKFFESASSGPGSVKKNGQNRVLVSLAQGQEEYLRFSQK